MSTANALALVQQLKSEQQDFEWYPTTAEIIQGVKRDILKNLHHTVNDEYFSVLDCGAGDGRVLRALTAGDKYAIEKADALLQAIGSDIFIVGTDFHEQSLIDKKVDVLFCNPPYSEYEMWATKIIRESNAPLVYLVIPARWTTSNTINDALLARDCTTQDLGTFDFLTADRAARATVSLVRFKMFNHRNDRGLKTDPFDVWFEEAFKLQKAPRNEDEEYVEVGVSKERVNAKAKGELVTGNDYVQILENLYNEDMDALFNNYRHFEQMDPDLLREVGVTAATVKKSLKARIGGLKDVYWQIFFDTFGKITSKLITCKRKHMLEKIMQHVSIDFTCSNAYAIAIWAIKNANVYFDEQLILVFERMISQANVVNYVSNKNTFGAERWRYTRAPEGLERYRLEYRVVLEYAGGICTSPWQHEKNANNGLTQTGIEYLRDLRTVADNLGFKTGNYDHEDPMRMPHWCSNVLVPFHADYKGSNVVLMEVRGFKNGNFHIKFNQDFLIRLNVEFGRLKGWLRNKQEAAAELDIGVDKASEAFSSNLRLAGTPQLVLGLQQSKGGN